MSKRVRNIYSGKARGSLCRCGGVFALTNPVPARTGLPDRPAMDAVRYDGRECERCGRKVNVRRALAEAASR